MTFETETVTIEVPVATLAAPDPGGVSDAQLAAEAREQVQKLLTKAHEAVDAANFDAAHFYAEVADRWLRVIR
jgi:hypothetical protein